MTKRMIAYSAMVLLLLTLSACSQGKSPVQQLKEPANSSAENDSRMEQILSMKEMAVPDLIVLVTEDTESDPEKAQLQWSAKVTAMNILSELKAEESLPALKEILEKSDSLSAINNSARTIGRIGGDKAFTILDQVFNKTEMSLYTMNDERKKAVIAAMGLCDDTRAIPVLIGAMNKSSNTQIIQIYAAGSLALLGRKDGLQVVNNGLLSEDGDIKLASTRALGLIGSSASVETLDNITKSDSEYIYQKAAKLSLIQIEEKKLSGADKTNFIQEQLLCNPRATEILQWGTMKLKKINTNDSRKVLQKLSEQSSPNFAVLKNAAKMRLMTME